MVPRSNKDGAESILKRSTETWPVKKPNQLLWDRMQDQLKLMTQAIQAGQTMVVFTMKRQGPLSGKQTKKRTEPFAISRYGTSIGMCHGLVPKEIKRHSCIPDKRTDCAVVTPSNFPVPDVSYSSIVDVNHCWNWLPLPEERCSEEVILDDNLESSGKHLVLTQLIWKTKTFPFKFSLSLLFVIPTFYTRCNDHVSNDVEKETKSQKLLLSTAFGFLIVLAIAIVVLTAHVHHVRWDDKLKN